MQLMTFDEVNTRIDQPMEHDIHLGRNGLSEYHVPWVDRSLYSPHGKSLIVYLYGEFYITYIFNLKHIFLKSWLLKK